MVAEPTCDCVLNGFRAFILLLGYMFCLVAGGLRFLLPYS